MNTEKKYGLKKTNALMLFVQMLLVLIGIGVSIAGIITSTKVESTALAISVIFTLLTYLAIVNFSVFGFKKNIKWFYLPYILLMVTYCCGIFIFTTQIWTVLEYALAFGAVFAAIVRFDNKKFVMSSLGISLVLRLAICLEFVIRNIQSLNLNYLLLAAQPIILLATIMVCYLTNYHFLKVKGLRN